MADSKQADTISIPLGTAKTRLLEWHRLLKEERRLFADADVAAIEVGKVVGDETPVANAVQMHLFTYEFSNTVMVLGAQALWIVTTESKAKYFAPLVPAMDNTGITVHIIATTDADSGFSGSIQRLLDGIMTEKRGDKLVYGHIVYDIASSKLTDAWTERIAREATVVNATKGFERILAVNDAEAQTNIGHAGLLSGRILRKIMLKTITGAVDEKKTITHSAISDEAAAAFADAAKLVELGFKIKPTLVDQHLPPAVQSGGGFDVDLKSANSDDKELKSNVILCSIGNRVKLYCAAVARTYLINPTPSQQAAYKVLEAAHSKLVDSFRPGAVVSDAVRAAVRTFEEKETAAGVALSAYLQPNFGYAIGLVPGEPVARDTAIKLRPGMAFVVYMAIHNVPLTDAPENSAQATLKKKKYSMWLADTIIVDANGVTNTCAKVDKEYSAVSFTLSEDSDEEDEDDEDEDGDEDADEEENQDQAVYTGRTRRSSRLMEQEAKVGSSLEETNRKRIEKQEALRSRQQAEALRRQATADNGHEEGEADEEVRPIRAYSDQSRVPTANPRKLMVDREHEAVLVPFYGQMVPFHVSTIKSVTVAQEQDATYLRLNFFNPSQALGRDAAPSMQAAVDQNESAIFVKNLNFKAKDPRNLNEIARVIKAMQLRMRERAREEEETKDLVEQAALIEDRSGRAPALQDLTMRPSIGLKARKSQGNLEAHRNGVRFTSNRQERVDILYANIKHAFYQPCKREHVVLIHFHLKNPILIGKKKHIDVQFYTEVVEASEALDHHGGHAYDPDELDDEERQRKLRARLNNMFLKFCEAVNKVVQEHRQPFPNAGFDVPTRDLGFYGVPFKESVFIQPCTAALVNLTGQPPFVLSLDMIDHVHFERVMFGSKSIDMVFILKEGKHHPEFKKDEFIRVGQVPLSNLDDIKNWLTDVAEITYTEGPMTLNWSKIIPDIVRQPDFFMDEDLEGETKPPGWSFLDNNASDDEEEETGSEYSEDDGEDEESEADSDDEWDSDAMVDEDEALAEEEEDADDDSDGEDWDELERKARDDDRRRYGEEDDRRGSKRKESGDRDRDADRNERAKPAKKPRK